MLSQVKYILICVIILCVMAAVAYLHFALDFFGLKGSDELKIDKTELVIEETKKISEFTSANFFEDKIIKKEKVDSGIIVNTNAEMVIIAHGKVRAGVNLANIKNEDFSVHRDTLKFNLPQPEIFDVIVNPSNYEIFVEDGKWSHEEVASAVATAKKEIQNDALESGILENAKKSSITKLTELYKALGFKVVEIQ